jgi:hypothetical protein
VADAADKRVLEPGKARSRLGNISSTLKSETGATAAVDDVVRYQQTAS